ncbi:Laminin subunit alpha-2 precursor, partial [Helicobacter pylori]|nr:Laminin subunit alpha-2 precursor [Helicobacter pylori]
MSKISNNYNPSLMVRDYHRVGSHARKEENKEIQNLSENDEKIKLAKQAKQDNLAIGDLESRL